MIKKLFGQSPAAPEDVPPIQSGRLITSVEVQRSASARDDIKASPGETSPRRPDGGEYGGLSDADVERIAARVAERLMRGPMADTVTRVVAEVSERLVREEIARIRAAANKTA